jgi:hypothetical protein
MGLKPIEQLQQFELKKLLNPQTGLSSQARAILLSKLGLPPPQAPPPAAAPGPAAAAGP